MEEESMLIIVNLKVTETLMEVVREDSEVETREVSEEETKEVSEVVTVNHRNSKELKERASRERLLIFNELSIQLFYPILM